MIDVFSPDANKFISQSLDMLAAISGGFDGLYLRGNSPFTNSNGSDFAAPHSAINQERLL